MAGSSKSLGAADPGRAAGQDQRCPEGGQGLPGVPRVEEVQISTHVQWQGRRVGQMLDGDGQA